MFLTIKIGTLFYGMMELIKNILSVEVSI